MITKLRYPQKKDLKWKCRNQPNGKARVFSLLSRSHGLPKFYALWTFSCHSHPFLELYRSVFFAVVVVVFGYVLGATFSVSVWVIEIINCSVFCTNSFIWISCWALAFWIIYQRFRNLKSVFPPKKRERILIHVELVFILSCHPLRHGREKALSAAFSSCVQFVSSFPIIVCCFHFYFCCVLLIVSAVLFIDCVSLFSSSFFLHSTQFDLVLFLSVWKHYATIKYLWWAFFLPFSMHDKTYTLEPSDTESFHRNEFVLKILIAAVQACINGPNIQQYWGNEWTGDSDEEFEWERISLKDTIMHALFIRHTNSYRS